MPARGAAGDGHAPLAVLVPPWNTVYGGFKPFYYADVHSYFHDLGQMPEEFVQASVALHRDVSVRADAP
jgi:hypothetical protein